MANNFALPITAQSTPAVVGNGNGFGQPSGVSIGPAAGGFGGVAGTHPGSTFQAVNNPREQVRFQVQPQVTVVVKPVFPLPESDTDSNGARRKDFLMTVNSISTGNKYDPESVDLNKYRFQGQVVCTVQQANVFLEKIARLGVDIATGGLVDPKTLGFSELEMYMYKKFKELANATGNMYEARFSTDPTQDTLYTKFRGTNQNGINGALQFPEAGLSPVRAASIPELVCQIFHPLGVYNSRGTHNAMDQFSGRIPHNNVSDMLGVNISNYSFMRDIWGVPMRAGDLLELVAYESVHPSNEERSEGKSANGPLMYHTGNSDVDTEKTTYVQFQPMCGLQYCQIEDFYTNDQIGVIPKHTDTMIADYKDSSKVPISGDLYIEVEDPDAAKIAMASDMDVSNGYSDTGYTRQFLKHVFSPGYAAPPKQSTIAAARAAPAPYVRPSDRVQTFFPFVRLPIARLWVAPLHQPFMYKKALPMPYKQDFNMVGYNAGKSDVEASLDSDWVLPNQNVGNLIYNKSKEFHNIEVELLCSHIEVF